ncbi:MAG: oxidoreductase [Gammaproteobacteria bacterium]|nr:oxidoreductase [Gammaproteobacteria bacterium]|tara:strand:+ start:1139 stop:2215 length:1077 start_codon:yes stop_codon:yes gene_type:complete
MVEGKKRSINLGILGCGPIAQAGHFESASKGRNTSLYAICDVAEDLIDRFSATYNAKRVYKSYEEMLADPNIDAVIIATADAFHVPASLKALSAGKHVFCEKPLGVSLEEVMQLENLVKESGLKLQVGHMKRFDPGLQSAKEFIVNEMGQMLTFKGWYCDSIYRYTVTDAVQPLIIKSDKQRQPNISPKSDLEKYYMLAHGCHLVDTARFLCGEITAVRARHLQRFNAYSWFIEVNFASGALGHLDLTTAIRMDWHEGFHLMGEHGSVIAKTFNPWYFRSSEVDIFREKNNETTRVLGADGHFYRRQLESFADAILENKPIVGADINDGLASVRAMLAISQSSKTGNLTKLSDVSGLI